MAANYEYGLDEVNLSICGIVVSGGGAAQGFISVTMPKVMDAKSGAHGDAVSFKTGNSIATFTLSLLEADPVVRDLIALTKNDQETAGGAGIGAFLLENLSTGLEVRGDCRLDGYPTTIAFAADAPELQFEGKIFGVAVTHRDRTEV